MRKTLIAAVALAPLWFVASRSPADATTTIGNTRTTPIATATANNGAPDDISIVSGGAVQPTGGGTSTNSTLNAVTLNSNNTVTNAGTISFSNANDVVGILVTGGNTGVVNNNSVITVSESFTPGDANTDGALEAPFVTATSSGRYGIRVTGASPFTGQILNASGGVITVRGNDSFGISVEAPVVGSLTDAGSITYTGNGGAGINTTASISGSVLVTGSVTAQGSTSATTGRGASAIVLDGDVGGRFSIYSTIATTGYGTATRPATPQLIDTVQKTPSELLQSGPAVVVGGNIAGGVFIGAPPVNTGSGTTTDADGDGTADSSEGTAAISNSGSAPALLVGAAGRDITLGEVDPTGANLNGYGLVIRGSVGGAGVYDGVASQGVVIGYNANGVTHAATIDGGVRIVGGVTASSYGASATALHITGNSVVPELRVEGTLSATILPPNTLTSTVPAFSATGTALLIDPGSTVSTLTNSGTISATVQGDQSNVAAVVDQGGGISTVLNTGAIVTGIVPAVTGDTVSGTLTALDLRANTTGITLTQQQAPTQVVTTVTNSDGTSSVTTTTTPVVYPLIQSSAPISVTSTNGNTTVVTTIPASPSITGDVLLGSGSNSVNILAGTLSGALDLGSGPTAALTIDNGAVVAGKLSYSGAALSLNLNNGTLLNINPVTYNTANLNVGSGGILYFAIDPANARATQFLDSGPATIASGAKFGLTVLSTAAGTQTYTLISSPNLTDNSPDLNLAAQIPYLFNASIQDNQAGAILLTISQKTAAQLGLNPSQGAALGAVTQALPGDPAVENIILNQYTRTGFLKNYNQLLPDYAGGVFQAAAAASRAISRATAEPNEIQNPTGSRGAWAQELFVGVSQGAGSTDGFRGGGFGFVGGVETGGSGFGALGATLAFVSNNTDDPHLPGDNQTSTSFIQGGLYWQGESHGFIGDADVGVGYAFFDGRREFIATDASTTSTVIDRKNKSSWDGYTLSGRFGLAYEAKLLGFFLRPQVHLDYFRLDEGAYKEDPVTGGPAFSLAIGDRTGQETSGTASVVIGHDFGRGLIWRPQVELGVRDVFDGDAGSTTAQFLSGGPAFTLTPADITGLGGVARFKLKASTQYYEVGVEAGGETRDRYLEGDVRFNVRVLF